MLKLFIEWLECHYRVKREQMKLRLHLWSNLDEKVAKQFWSSGLGISDKNFTKSWIKPKGKGRRTHPHGVCRAPISSKKLLHEILTDIANEFHASIA